MSEKELDSSVNEFRKWSIKNNVKYIEVQVCDKNSDAVNLYKGNNFKNTKSVLQEEL